MKVLSIRHGEQLYPHNEQGQKIVCGPDAPLVDLGRKQLRELKKTLDKEGLNLDAIYRSALLRAKQSADELLEGYLVPTFVVDELKETFPNSAEGHTYLELEAIGGDIYAHPFSPDQETLEHLAQRSKAAKEFILSDAKKRGYSTIAIVGHGDPLCALDWVIKHEGFPRDYSEMRDSYYPQKAQALEYIFNPDFKLEGEGKIITTEASRQTIEGFRNSFNKEV